MNKRYTKEMLEPVIKESKTWSDVCRRLGVKPMTGAQCHIKKRSENFNIDSSHFLGQASTKGRIFPKKNAIGYCFKGSKINSHTLKSRLIRDGYKEAKCEICQLSEWRGNPIVLELDHIDSDHYNNELTNLQIICPNCHADETRKRRGVAGTVDNLVLETKVK